MRIELDTGEAMVGDEPLVSILTPSFNQSRWLKDNLKSVQAQTYRNIEQIVVDGGSSDATTQILKKSASNVRWTSEPDRGQSHALNKAFDQSNGGIIGWINSDDAYADRRAVAEAVAMLERYPEVGVVYGHGIVLSESNDFMQALWSPHYSERLLKLGVLFLQPSLFFRRSVLPTPLVREDLNYVMDWALFLALQGRGVGFKRVPLVVGVDRHQAQRKTLQMSELDSEIGRVIEAQGLGYGRKVKLERKVSTVGRRLVGVPMAARLPTMIDPAIEINFFAASRRIRNQGLLPRRFLR
jgi:glycosyltransferase involved in cell wall biosynthesis